MTIKNETNIDNEIIKLRINMIEHLLKYRFTWDEINYAFGFDKLWYEYYKQKVNDNHA